ncbi:dynamin family protein [Oceanobacillus manasiensis]|uniref:dynamin family protein n=1 Tax=Oceanobacillus manasiensis TaxID=586413 RepID=UPI000693C367|nr:dynamin family protein [Oceanobacillus manasiensis]
MQKEEKQLVIQRMASLYHYFVDQKDNINAEKLLDLYEKQQNDQFVISFAGHFSAGKSSMTNALLNEDLLPKSPVPTSANIVTISHGDGYIRVHYHNGEVLEIEEPYDLELIKQYSKDRDKIKQLDIRLKQGGLPKGTVIMDTPGIDAADDADRLMTESAMHLVDVVFYIMDYNHVQSEVNLQFLESLQDKRIPYYVVINQIDKHDESELSFASFEESIKQTFEQWGILPQRIFYSSLTNGAAIRNEFSVLKKTINDLIGNEPKAYDTTDHSLETLVRAHEDYLDSLYGERMPFTDQKHSLEEIQQKKHYLIEQKDALTERPEHIQDQLMIETQQTIKNAYLMPATLREKAEQFLASHQPDYKVGLFNSKKKTKAEQEARLFAFLEELNKSVKSSIEWRLKEKLSAILSQYQIHDTVLFQKIQDIAVNYTDKDLIRLMKTGATLNGDYLLNYTNDVSSDIKSKYKGRAKILTDQVKEALTEQYSRQVKEWERDISELEREASAREGTLRLERELAEKKEWVRTQLETDQPFFKSSESLENAHLKRKVKWKQTLAADQNYSIQKENVEKEIEKQPGEKRTSSQENVLPQLEETMKVLEDVPGVKHLLEDLRQKKVRLEDRSYTVALFGAFSAGKSSFANALLGNHVLPVSPNPTTAAVNRINPITDKVLHGDVYITLKKKTDLEKDLLEILKIFQPPDAHFEELLTWVKKHELQHSEELNPLYQSYLQAILDGYDGMARYIGGQLRIELDDLSQYVTDEKKACYIDVIDLYYDCEITRQGITLVDTPGADSVNARHTNSAFTYIKHADAILYVTYYNHALSQADKNFLMQLGRVKDTFELDKMFFLVNAADLAQDEQELKLVTDYVEDQLNQLGIRFAKLYPISSKQSLLEKRQAVPLNKKMVQFENAFQSFIKQDLSSLTIASATRDIERAKSALVHLLESSKLGQKEKEQHELAISRKKHEMEKVIKVYETDVLSRQIQQKISKQLFHVLERFGIRFHDMFKETFNPTTITQSGKTAQSELKVALQQLLDYTAFELLQEIQAVSLRIEALLNKLLHEVYQELYTKLNEQDTQFRIADLDTIHLETPTLNKGLQSVSTRDFHAVLATYRGTKAFFAKNEKEQMKEALFQQIRPLASAYLDEMKGLLEKQYTRQWEENVTRVQKDLHMKVTQYVEDSLAMLTSPLDTEVLTEKIQKMERILTNQITKD